MDALFICPAVCRAIWRDACINEPCEAAGLIAIDGQGIVTAAAPVAFGDEHSVRLPRAVVATVEARLQASGLTPAGTYHSHPRTPAYPTEADRRFLMRGSGLLMIASLRFESLRAFLPAPDGRSVVELAVIETGIA